MFYDLRKSNKLDFQIELSDYCNSKCPACARFTDGRNGLIASKSVDKHEITYNDFSSWFSPEFLQNKVSNLRINGQVGESTLCKDLLKIVRYIRKSNSNIPYFAISTNGGTNDKFWWYKLGKEFSRIKNSRVVFAIDGLEDTLSMYRINVDFNKVIENAKTFISAGGNAQWRMLTFEHNQHQIKDCENLSKSLGFSSFVVRPTGGFTSNDELKFTYRGEDKIIRPPSDQKNVMKVPEVLSATEIECSASIDNAGDFVNRLTIDNRGVVHPCCFFSYECRRVYHKFYETGNPNCPPELGTGRRTNMYYNSVANILEEQGGIKSICLYYSTLDEILETPFYKERLESSWKKKNHNGDLSVCGYMCSKKVDDIGDYHRMGKGYVQHALI